VADQTKERILDAAYRALVKRGYHETSMKDIAAEAGVAPGLAHYYFETKEDLLVAAIERACQPVMEAWRQAGMNLTGPLPEDADPMVVARMGFELAKEELRTYRGLFLLTFDISVSACTTRRSPRPCARSSMNGGRSSRASRKASSPV